MSTRYTDANNTFYIQFYDSNNNYCLGSDGFIYFCPDRRWSSHRLSDEMHKSAMQHADKMNNLGKDFAKYELLTRQEWSNLK